MVKKISMVLGIVVAIFIVIGSLWKYDQYKADASELKKANEQIQLKADAIELKKANEQILLVSARLDQKIINDNIRALQRQIWDTKMYYQKMGQQIPPEVQRNIQRWEADIQRLQRQLGR